MIKIGMMTYNTKDDLLSSGYKLYECKHTMDSYINIMCECRRLYKNQKYLISNNGCVCDDTYIPTIINYITESQLSNNFNVL
jgi:hypothetical protein